jgi:hypothetical protein
MDIAKEKPQVPADGTKGLDSNSQRNPIAASAAKQRALVLKLLREAGAAGRSTLELRYTDGIYHPPARVLELRDLGFEITTTREWQAGPDGIRHMVGRYHLISESGGAL